VLHVHAEDKDAEWTNRLNLPRYEKRKEINVDPKLKTQMRYEQYSLDLELSFPELRLTLKYFPDCLSL